jgi:hypothetical protein
MTSISTAAPVTTRSPASQVLTERLADALDDAQDIATAVYEHPNLRAVYPELVRMLHGVIRASVPLLRAAEHEAVRLSATGDPVATALIPYLQEHAIEELHHDDWLLDDYAALGLDPRAVLDLLPSPTVAAMVGAVYYWILHVHPVAIMGYLAVTEGWPPSLELIDEIQRRSGYPAEAFATLRHHSAIDPDHGDEMWELLDSLDLTETQLGVITDVAVHAMNYEVSAINELLQR